MADYNSILPVKTASNGDVVVKLVDTGGANILAIDSSGRISADINDISAGVQSNDVIVTLDGETVELAASTAIIGKVYITDGTEDAAVDANNSLQVNQRSGDVWKVEISGAASTGEVHDYNTAAAVAAGAISNHDYTVTALKTLLWRQVLVSASDRFKAEFQVETGVGTGIYTTFAVMFGTGATGEMVDVTFSKPKEVAAGVKARVIRTNRDNQALDLYSTIIGEEI